MADSSKCWKHDHPGRAVHRSSAWGMKSVAGECAICAKHRGEGPLQGELIGRTERFWVYHAAAKEDGQAALGHLFIESNRHAPYLGDLTDAEAAELGALRSRLAAALREQLDAEFVFAAVIGRGHAHFHEHLLARHRGTPDEVPWDESDEAAPRATPDEVRELASRLRTAVGA
jgi:diadenosine tetraphosphate (Ap4A) HIT family hydrolase